MLLQKLVETHFPFCFDNRPHSSISFSIDCVHPEGVVSKI